MMEELRKNEQVEANIDGFSSDGGGVCHIGGRAVFVPRALPGERWRVRIVKANHTAVWGRGEELISPVPERVEPACPVFGRCGGCATMHMDYDCELRFKLGRLNDALQRIGGLSLRAESIEGADKLAGYRNKGIYNFASGPTAGFYRARSHDVITVSRCLLQPECFDRAAEALRLWMEEKQIPAYDEATGKGLVRHLYLRKSSSGFSACIVSAGTLPDGAAEALRRTCPELTGIMLCLNRNPENTVLTDDIRTLWGSDIVTEQLCGATFRLSPLTFFQINTAQAEKLYRIVGEFAEPAGKEVLDLYCGAGTIGLSVARSARKLIGSDIVPSAVENARFNALENGVENAEYLCGDAGQVSIKLVQRGEKPDVVLVDPPRKGLDEAVIGAICDMAPTRLVYVSCDPATLARDLRLLDGQGYLAIRCRAVDMFPRTRHVEAVALLEKVQA
jgi:23S rRNA (uracil-5-)-methyltransferase RumA